ncbi:MAG TPA: hypothetical protein VHF69_09230, partial [Candidatus Synoicihabitans sp.]|nr:hypothetical protein [Candidatus Synoicihabitans sp.]
MTPLAALAQQGDRSDEPQQPLPEHLVVPPAPPLSPEEALASFHVARGLRLELVAAEPLVEDPVAITFAPDGSLWVVEMRGYMPNVDGVGEDQPVGVVAVLRDTDGDGRMDQRREFATGLVMPRALAWVDGGLLVAEPPHLWWMRDTDGDDVADTRTEVANDYGSQGNPEHTANGLLWAMDNWIYNAKHNVRFRYLGQGEWTREQTIARGQWGISQDDHGRLFYNNNSVPLQTDLVPAEYFQRNPAPPPLTSVDRTIGSAGDARLWPIRVTPGVNRGYRTLDETGRIREVTAACAPVIYRSDALGPEFRNNAFICEPSGNLLKRLLVEPSGNGDLTAFNAYEGEEVLSSTDERFRPVNLAIGPDDALYIVDMYRGIIQHRTFVTTFLRQQIEQRNLERPLGMGRIYRLVADGAAGEPAPSAPALDRASASELVAALDHVGSWWRDTAQRRLVERRPAEAVEPLRELARRGSPLGRLHALWTLHGMEALDRKTVLAALEDNDAAVRAAGLRMAEPAVRAGDSAMLQRVTALAADASPDVRRQLALTLGEAPADTGWVRLQLATESADVVGMGEALVSGLSGREVQFARALAERSDGSGANVVLATAVMTVIRRGDPTQVRELIQATERESVASRALTDAVLSALERLARRGQGRGEGQRRRVALPIETSFMRTWAESSDAALAARAAALAPWLDAPGAATVDEVR